MWIFPSLQWNKPASITRFASPSSTTMSHGISSLLQYLPEKMVSNRISWIWDGTYPFIALPIQFDQQFSSSSIFLRTVVSSRNHDYIFDYRSFYSVTVTFMHYKIFLSYSMILISSWKTSLCRADWNFSLGHKRIHFSTS